MVERLTNSQIPFVIRVLKRLNQEQREVLHRRLLATQDTFPYFKQVLVDWETYLIIIEQGTLRKSPFQKSEKQVWETIDKSLPILVETRLSRLKVNEPQVWFIRILKHKVEGKCIDLRQFKKVSDQYTEYFEPTENGITIPIINFSNILDGIWKMFRKHKS